MSPKQRIYSTVAYADIFDYPLTPREVRRWLIGADTRIPVSIRGLTRRDPYFTLVGRQNIIKVRRERCRVAVNKWKFIRLIAARYGIFPTVLLVGVTGGLSMDNAKVEDDIDLFFVISPGSLWVTRFLVTLYTELMGLRRRPEETSVRNKVCLNMFMSADSLALFPKDRDLFSAHEVLQMVPLWERNGTYRRFLSANEWVKGYLPNAWAGRMKNAQHIVRRRRKKATVSGLYLLSLVLELPARVLQLWYMRRHRTSEVITAGVLRFHPHDARAWIRKKYAKRLTKYNIPLDNIFYHR